MKFTVERNALNAALGRAAPLCDTRSPIPILACLRLSAGDAGLAILGTDMDAAINETVPVALEIAGTICTPADSLRKLIGALPAGLSVEFEREQSGLRVRCGKTSAVFETLPPDDYPEFSPERGGEPFRVKAVEFSRVLSAALPSMSTDRDRAYLNGLCLRSGREGIAAIATDGHRGAIFRLSADAPAEFPETILPRQIGASLAGLLKGNAGDLEIAIGETKARFASDNWSLITKLIDGSFPDFTRWQAQLTPAPAIIPADDLSAALDRLDTWSPIGAAALNHRGVYFTLADNSMQLRRGPAGGHGIDDEIAVGYAGAPVAFGANGRYVQDALTALGDGEVEFHVIDAGSTIRLCRRGEQFENATILPMRI